MRIRRRAFLHTVAATCLVAFCVSAQADIDLLHPDDFFRVSTCRLVPDEVGFTYITSPDHPLDRDRFTIKPDNPAVTLTPIDLPPPLEKFDKVLGKHLRENTGRVMVRVPLSGADRVATAQGGTAIVGVCYARISRVFNMLAIGGQQV